MTNFHLIILWSFAIFFMACSKNEPAPPEVTEPEGPAMVEKTNPMKLHMHYMPWFETPKSSDNGSWGIHWTMATENPDNIDSNGKREIASHYYPSIGPYASSDADVIEYHLLLMKYAGIDGIIIDWYGSSELWDYPLNRKNAEAVIKKLKEVGLDFAITYEDRTLEPLESNGLIETAVEGAIADMAYLEDNYFNKSNYIQINKQPLLTVFGPITLQSKNEWNEIIASMSEQPTLLSLWHESNEMGSNAAGEMAWIYQDNTHLMNFYTNKYHTFDFALGAAYPGFVDYYEEGGWGAGMDWSIAHEKGATLETTLKLAKEHNIKDLQLVTWNDFGEGTMIEPTDEFAYTFLEKIQTFAGVEYKTIAFEYITAYYQLRKSKANNEAAQSTLDEAYLAFVQLELEKAMALIDELE